VAGSCIHGNELSLFHEMGVKFCSAELPQASREMWCSVASYLSALARPQFAYPLCSITAHTNRNFIRLDRDRSMRRVGEGRDRSRERSVTQDKAPVKFPFL
jgi:hypothetical protein